MTEEFYLDTSIWIDFHEKRGNNGVYALKFILDIIAKNNKICYSDLHVREFKKLGYSQDEINSILSIIKPDNVRHIHIFRKQLDKAKKLAQERKVPEKDTLHAILCRDNNLQLIARDAHFELLRDITTAKKPEDFT